MITLNEFKEEAQKGYTHIPLVLELLADLDTPMSIYLKLANKPYTYLLESVIDGERFGRYSFIGLPCSSYLKVRDGKTEVYQNHQIVETDLGNPIEFIDLFYKRFQLPNMSDLPRFNGGLVGYFAHEIIQYIEKKLAGEQNPTFLDVPDIFLLVSTEIAIIDNLTGKIYLIVYANVNETDAYQKAKDKLNDLRNQLRQNYTLPLSLGSESSEIQYEMGEIAYKKAVDKIKEYIFAGDCMQVVPSQRMYLKYHDQPLNLYRALRTINPSPYLIYFNFDDFYIVASSPELLVGKEKNSITVRPLAGTRKRGKTKEEDLFNEQDLLNDEKEISEHVMLIDLARNDVGRISKVGSVQVTEKMKIERYSHVMHIMSNVIGELEEGTSGLKTLTSTFPAGTLSGAPKIRAMEIIKELEPSKRGIYGGAIGYYSFTGDMDLAIAIRAVVIKDNTAYLQSGSGIVADSDPEFEWQETQNKAMALIRAVRMVEEGLDK